MQEILYDDDPIWHDSTLTAYDPHRLVWIDPGRRLARQLDRPVSPADRDGQGHLPDPQHVEIEANLESPGVVVLADVYYPGWTLTIDDQPAPIYRVNRMMRGAAVGAGPSPGIRLSAELVLQFGGPITLGGLAITALLGLGCLVRSRSRRRDQ